MSEASTSIDGFSTSASARKVSSQYILGGSKERAESISGYRFSNLELLFEFVTKVGCKHYGDSSLVLEDKKHE